MAMNSACCCIIALLSIIMEGSPMSVCGAPGKAQGGAGRGGGGSSRAPGVGVNGGSVGACCMSDADDDAPSAAAHACMQKCMHACMHLPSHVVVQHGAAPGLHAWAMAHAAKRLYGSETACRRMASHSNMLLRHAAVVYYVYCCLGLTHERVLVLGAPTTTAAATTTIHGGPTAATAALAPSLAAPSPAAISVPAAPTALLLHGGGLGSTLCQSRHLRRACGFMASGMYVERRWPR